MFQGSHVPKLKDGVRLIIHRKLPKDSRIGNVAFSMDTDGRIFASVEYRYSLKMEMDIRKAVLSKDQTIADKLSFLGLDYSQQNFYVDSEGRKANYPHWYRKSEAKIIRLQRELSHMEKGSSNYGKQLKKIERLHIKIRTRGWTLSGKKLPVWHLRMMSLQWRTLTSEQWGRLSDSAKTFMTMASGCSGVSCPESWKRKAPSW